MVTPATRKPTGGERTRTTGRARDERGRFIRRQQPEQPRRRRRVYGRRVPPGEQTALVASAAHIPLDDKRALASLKRRRQMWQTEAWDYFDEVGEIHYTVQFLGNLMSKLRLFPATLPDPKSSPVPVDSPDSGVDPDTAKLAIDTLERLRSLQGGQSTIVRDVSMNLEVAGECFLHGHQDDETGEEDWQIRSVDELIASGDSFQLREASGSNAPVIDIPTDDQVIRLWERHPRFGELATCAMRGVLAEAEALLLLSREIRATSKSRLSNGILLIPSELSFGSADPTRDQGDGEEEDDPFDLELRDAMVTPIQEEGSASAVVPLTLRGPAEFLKEVRHIALDKALDPVLDTRIEARIIRIARGLNMPVEVTTGLMATTFANAVQVKQSEFEDHVQPRAVLLCDAITAGYFQPALDEAGIDKNRLRDIFVWYDAEQLIAKPDQAEQAEIAHKDGVISDEARRRYIGFSEDDAPTDDEMLRRILFHTTRLDPFVAAQLFVITGLAPDLDIPNPATGILGQPGPVMPTTQVGLIPGEPPKPGQPNPNENPHAPGQPAETGKKDTTGSGPGQAPASNVAASGAPANWERLGRRLTRIDSDLRTRTLIALDGAMKSALRRAGNRILSRIRRDKGGGATALQRVAATTPPERVAAALGPTLLTGAGITDADLLTGAFDRTCSDIGGWVRMAWRQALAEIERVAGPVDRYLRDDLEIRHRRQTENTVTLLSDTMAALASARLYDPAPGLAEQGETDPSVTVPVSIVRVALAVAGGGNPIGGDPILQELLAAGSVVNVPAPVKDALGGPSWGVATGPDAMSAVTAAGGQTEAYQWDYGAAMRHTFEPHLDLDGKIFTQFDDSRLEVGGAGSWIGSTHYMPGDHAGCLCDIIPILVGPDGGASPAVVPEGETLPSVYADALGFLQTSGEITAEELKAAEADLSALRGEVRQAANQIAQDHLEWLRTTDAEIIQHTPKMTRLPDGTYTYPGAQNWDWWPSLSELEQKRLRLNWMAAAGNTSALGPDEIVAHITQAFGGGISEQQAIDTWLQETRIVNAMKNLASGKTINPASFGGLDLNAMIDSPYDLNKLFAVKTEAIQEVAAVNARAMADEALRILGNPTEGAAPWTLTENQYMTELSNLEQAAKTIRPLSVDPEWGATYRPADEAVLRRLAELVPNGIEDPANPLPPDELYRAIIRLARAGGLV